MNLAAANNEKVLSITESRDGDGYVIKTDSRTYNVYIDDRSQCCESFGSYYLMTVDDKEEFIGKTLLSVTFDDSYYVKCKKPSYEIGDSSCFVTFKFNDNSVFQIVCYNEHNGYYSHGYYVKVTDNDGKVVYSDESSI